MKLKYANECDKAQVMVVQLMKLLVQSLAVQLVIQFGEGDGKDAMTLAGMFLGASLAHDDELAQGPGVITTKCYIETRYRRICTSKVYSHSFKIAGRKYIDFIK